MQGMMKTAVMTDCRSMTFTNRPIPVPEPDEVLIRVDYVGICGSDIHYYESGRIGNFIVKPPFVLGHEASGTVVEAGENVTDLKPGDRVCMEPGRTCGKCEWCRKGLYNLCPDVSFFATPPVDGVFQEYVTHEAALCFKLPEQVSSLEGALIEPLAVGFHAANQGQAGPGMVCAVTGAGCIGLVSMMALKVHGVKSVFVADILEKRLEKALELGADGVINSKSSDTAAELLRITGGSGADLVIEASGNEEAAQNAIIAAKPGGTVVFVGYSPSGMQTLPIGMCIDKELTLKTVFRYRHIYPMAIDAVAAGRVNLKGLCTHIFDFDALPEAMESCVTDKQNIVKAAVRMRKE